ncbi:agmatinase, partial [Tremellales sp. Uapishka_1]
MSVPDQSPASAHLQRSPRSSEIHLGTAEPPQHLALAPASKRSMTSPLTAPTRLSSKAAGRGISIAPALASGAGGRHSISGAFRSIWSAGIVTGAGSGWGSPALTSTKGGPRGLHVAVLKVDDRDLLVDGGLASPGLRSAPLANGEKTPVKAREADKRKEIILCRHYHTPGLTCTSRPCRFVHNLDDSAPLSARSVAAYQMQSPGTPGLGTFAQQQKGHTRTLSLRNLDIKDVVAGERVVVEDGAGEEFVGEIYMMSGGGKGPGGKSKAKWKTEQCRDHADGHCPYGDYCSFLHGALPEPKTRSQKRASLPVSALSAWAKALPRSILEPDVKIIPSVLDRQAEQLSAFAPPFSDSRVQVDSTGRLVLEPPAVTTPPVKSAWSKGPPLNVKKVVIEDAAKSLVPPEPASAPPATATSLFGTESDPATPWDPAVRYHKQLELKSRTPSPIPPPPPTAPVSQVSHEIPMAPQTAPPYPSQSDPNNEPYFGEYPPTYPWGMPMSPPPLPMYQQFPGGPGVLWTPAGWAVQDAAMKIGLKNVATKTRHPQANPKAKNYFRTKPCKFFQDGYCPHGDSCTYRHDLPSDESAAPENRKPPVDRTHTLPCKFFNSASGCLNGASCSFVHTLVVPDTVPLVEKPRPWRTRPCRHYQVGTCTLGDACHFAHVYDDTYVERDGRPSCPSWTKTGRCAKGSRCDKAHIGEGGQGNVLTEERLKEAFEEIRRNAMGVEGDGSDDDDDDDVEIVSLGAKPIAHPSQVTIDTSRTLSPTGLSASIEMTGLPHQGEPASLTFPAHLARSRTAEPIVLLPSTHDASRMLYLGIVLALVGAPLFVISIPDQQPFRNTYSEYLSGSNEPQHPPAGHQHRPRPVTAYGFEDPINAALYAQKDPQRPQFPPYNLDEAYWGLKTFAHIPPVRCMTVDNATLFDIAVLGAPFDTATSWRPGARFGPGGIRNGAQRLGGANRLLGVAPFQDLKIVDCGDSKMSYYSNDIALATLEEDYYSLTRRGIATAFQDGEQSLALDGKHHPRVVMLGGDHTIVLPALRALNDIYGPVSVIHFDSHCDSRHPDGGTLTHGDYFYFAWKEGLMSETNIHAGIRANCDMPSDIETNFTTVLADEIEDIGWKGVIKRIKERVGTNPVYLTIDIDTLDPAFAASGWTSREMIKILHGLKDLKIVGADVVEVAPAYDDQAETTQIVAAGLVFELISIMALTPVIKG